MILHLCSLLVFAAAVTPVITVWIGEEYWASVSKEGQLLDGRTRSELLRFDTIFNGRIVDAYVAFWIVDDERGHHESFGQAWITSDGRVCARFVGRWDNHEELCGGFRVLAKHRFAGYNPFRFVRSKDVNRPQAVAYRGVEIAKITAWQKNFAFFGNADLKHERAYGIEYDTSLVTVERSLDPLYFDNFIEILVMLPQSEHFANPDPIGSDLRSYQSLLVKGHGRAELQEGWQVAPSY